MKPIYTPKGRALEYAPFAANLYRGCTNGCTYCFAPLVLREEREVFHAEATLREGSLEGLEKQLATGNFAGKQILLSFTTDPYQPGECGRQNTRTALQLIKEYGSNFAPSRKGD